MWAKVTADGALQRRGNEQAMNHPSIPKFFACIAAAILLLSMVSFGAETSPAAAKIREIEDNLIAPCCWSQPVSQHDSEVAQQIRDEVTAMVGAGKSREEILDFFVARYGERILVTPRARGFNRLAYILPWAALPLGTWGLFLLLRKLKSPAPAPAQMPMSQPDSRYSSIIEKEMREMDE
jgi:cytochrome c-type biogenesis protein CcmH